MSVDADGGIYLYDFHAQPFRRATGIGSNFTDFGPGGGNGVMGVCIVSVLTVICPANHIIRKNRTNVCKKGVHFLMRVV